MESFSSHSTDELTEADLIRGREHVLAQVRWGRQYSLQMLESIPADLWYEKPAGLDTHVAWQVGHLAVSQYGLMLFRQRGRSPGDLELMPGWLRKQFGRGSAPMAFSDSVPSVDELMERLDKIHQQSLLEVEQLEPQVLAEPTEMPYTAYPIKLGALLFCPLHESLHAGQIGLLRRAHGLPPIR